MARHSTTEKSFCALFPVCHEEYSVAIDKETEQLLQEAATKFTEASKANEISEEYLLLTAVFGVALFLGGITAAFKRRRVRAIMLALSIITLTVTANLHHLFASGKEVMDMSGHWDDLALSFASIIE